ncbi:MAG TPA: four helix bundle protein [Ginsengibacter sp.]|nr:four helix bundle protein [Ginsengibacter sp.]
MKPDNIILEKSYNFSLRIIKLYIHLRAQKVERELLIQLLKSGTSIGANVEEAVGAQSKSDFIHKFGIAYKESRETSFWLRLFKDANIIGEKLSKSFLSDSEELKKILASILKTSKGIKTA